MMNKLIGIKYKIMSGKVKKTEKKLLKDLQREIINSKNTKILMMYILTPINNNGKFK